MQAIGWARGFAAALTLAALSLAEPAWAAWPNAAPAQPLIQAERVCAPGIVPLSTTLSSGQIVSVNRRCHVLDFTDLGRIKGREWYYAFYATHWADRHGKQDRGYPVIFYLQGRTTLRLSYWVDDAPGLAGRWGRIAPPHPVLIRRPEATYLGLTLKAPQGADEQRLIRLDGIKWRAVSVLYRSTEDQALIAAALPKHCETVDDGLYDWAGFRWIVALRTRAGDPCGTLSAVLNVRQDTVYLTQPMLQAPPPPPLIATRP